RSYCSSPGRPTQPGILADYTAALTHTLHRFPNARVVLYGHSLGGAVALCLLAQPNLSSLLGKDADRLSGVILENPFTSVPAMIKALYPQKWLPYRYFTPFVWDRWDALGAVEKVDGETSLLRRLCGRMLVLTSERDEVVPKEMGPAIVRVVSDNSCGNGEGESLRTRLVVIRGALHEDGWTRKGWEDVVGVYLRGIVDETKTIDG
ncbi:Protein bem46, partial [Termitomyces sp. J132]